LGWLKRTANHAVGIIAGNGVFAEWGCFGFVCFSGCLNEGATVEAA